MKAVRRIFMYIKGSPENGLWFKSNEHLRIECYCDVDWAGCVDDRRSIIGYCVLETILWFGGARSKTWLLDLQLRLSIGLSH
jgi:hypothetical protein